jgi:mRNA interferase MazF
VEGPVKGDVVVLPFPFSDLTKAKRRPALVLTVLPGDDVILCQITSAPTKDADAVAVGPSDFTQGGLSRPSHVRPNHIFTAARQLLLYRAGRLSPAKLAEILDKAVEILRR